jgi:predicted anti-sigma-YlaC factor YlaD
MNDITSANPTSPCRHWREVASAMLDGEADADEERALDQHLASCAACRSWRNQAQSIGRSMRVREAESVPDQTEAILARADAEADRRRLCWALRVAVGVVGLVEAIFAIGDFVDESGTSAFVHAERHSGAFALAFAVALIVVAVQPERVRGLLPMGVVLAAIVVVTSIVELVQGESPAFGELRHLLELAGVALMALLGRVHAQLGARPGHGGRHRHPGDPAEHGVDAASGSEAA